MYKWYIKIYLKGGHVIKGYTKSEHKDSVNIIEEFFSGDRYALNAIHSDEQTQLGFIVGSVEAFEISVNPL